MKARIAMAVAFLGAFGVFAAPVVTVQSAAQDAATGVVTVEYTLSEPAILTFDVCTNGASLAPERAWRVSGDINRKLAAGTHTLQWWPRAEWPDGTPPTGCRVALVPWTLEDPPDYMVVKLGINSNVTYHATAGAVPFGVKSDTSRRHQMVFRRVRATNVRWRMGTDGDTGNETPHYVTLTNDYYMAVFITTFEQHNMFTGTSGSAGDKADNRWHYENLRGATSGHDWPTDGHAVAADSAIGRFRAQSGLTRIDLPTEAEWEYACRAGNSGKWCCGDNSNLLPKYAWYSYRYDAYIGSTAHAHPTVGLLDPNAFGLYDMHGTGFEWCLDWYAEGADYCVAGSDVTAPTGPTTGSGRVVRGGSYAHDHTIARSAYRYKNGQPPGTAYTTLAYRLVCPVDMRTAEDGAGTEGKPVAAFADVTGFDPVVVDSDGAGGFGTAAAPLDFKARFDVLIDGLDFDSRKPFGFHLILR